MLFIARHVYCVLVIKVTYLPGPNQYAMKKYALLIFLISCSFYVKAQDASSKETIVQEQQTDAKKIKVFPNPATNVVHLLGLVNSQKAFIRISDVYGNVVLQRQWAIRDASLSIPIPNLESGIYVVSVNSPEQKVQLKFYKN